MSGSDSYIFIDGSSLLADVSRLWSTHDHLRGRRLDLLKFHKHFTGSEYFRYLGGGYRRLTTYFVAGELRVETLLTLPDFKKPNIIEDMHIRYCGKLVGGGKKFQKWIDDHTPPQYVMDRLNKAEKAVDTQICCDALQLAANRKLDRLFLYSNDYDFMPLLEVLKSMGCNVTLIQLTEERVNSKLVSNTDSFCVPNQDEVEAMFESVT